MLLWQLSRFASHSVASLEIEHGLECLGDYLNYRFMFSRSGWGMRVSMHNKLAGVTAEGLEMTS